VGYSFKNYWGVWDMHGLVWEWVADFNAQMTTGASRKDAGGLDRQLFCAAGSIGSTDPNDYASFMRYAMRGSVKARYAIQNMGFRCARDAAER
jgi:formylglycine-generating enzyme required for sulfatase activity